MKRGATWQQVLKNAQTVARLEGVEPPGAARLGRLVRWTLDVAIAMARKTGRPVVIPGFASVRVVEKKARMTLGRDGAWHSVPPRRRVAIRPAKGAHAQVER